MIQSTTRLGASVQGNGQVSSENSQRLAKLGSHQADRVDASRGKAAPPVSNERPAAAAGSAEANLEHQAAVVNRLQSTLSEARDAVARIQRAPEAQKPQASSESSKADSRGGNGGAAAAAKATRAVTYVMTQREAEAIAVDIYASAFPGVGFTRNDLAAAVAQLRTGLITPEKLAADVQEGAALINNTAGDVAGAQARAPGRHPNRQSTIAQELRLQRLAALMEAGILPEDKFTINGNFSYNQGAPVPKGRFTENMAALQARQAAKGPVLLGRDLARSIERFKTNVTNQETSQEGNDGLSDRRINRAQPKGKVAKGIDPGLDLAQGNEQLIKGNRASAPPVTTTGSTGQPANGGFSVGSASLSDLSELSDEMNDRSSENSTEPPPPPPPSGDPIGLDLNHDGRIGTTGTSTAKDHADKNATVAFDLDGDGRRDRTEWMKGDGDGLLVDDHDGEMGRIASYRGDVDASRLFGDEGGKYANGYEKLAGFDVDHDGKVSGHELDALKVWVDDGDARLEEGELKTLAELGVTELNVTMQLHQNDQGETLMRSTFTQNGEQHMTEDVWFGMDGKAGTGERGFLGHMLKSLTESTAETQGKMLRRLDAAIVEIDDLNRDIDDRRTHMSLGNQANQHLHHMMLGGSRV